MDFNTGQSQNWATARRRGTVAVTTALLLPVLLMFVALAADLAVISAARAQLRTAADAAALAAAARLASPVRLQGGSDLSAEIASADLAAREIALANFTLGQPTRLPDGWDQDANGDMVMGFIDLSGSDRALTTDPAWQARLNSVRVTASRVDETNGQVPAIFGRLLGYAGYNARASATATVQNYAIAGFPTTPRRSTGLIPIALNRDVYEAMLRRETADNFGLDRDQHTVSRNPDGIHESTLFPDNSGPGNWGTVRIGLNNNGTSYLIDQIDHGVHTDQITAAFGAQMTAAEDSPSFLGGNPGLSLGMKDALLRLVGKDVIVPIYDPERSGGSGSTYQYAIVGFAAVTVMDFRANGIHSDLVVQPTFIEDPHMIAGDPLPSWTDGGVVRLHLTN